MLKQPDIAFASSPFQVPTERDLENAIEYLSHLHSNVSTKNVVDFLISFGYFETNINNAIERWIND